MKNINRYSTKTLCTALTLIAFSFNTYALDNSVLLTNTITDGYGKINLFETLQTQNSDKKGKGKSKKSIMLSAKQLEKHRLNNDGAILIGVDVNEATRGSEKDESQGIAIKKLHLVAMIDGNEHIFTEYSTETQTLIAEKNSHTRMQCNTLLGHSGGQSSVLPENSVKVDDTHIDSTLKILVDHSLQNATSAILYIELFDTNIALGDPESFYDNNGEPEKLALLTAGDAKRVNELEVGHQKAPMLLTKKSPDSDEISDQAKIKNTLKTISYPAKERFYLVGYEDLYPNTGDYDFNDLVTSYRIDYQTDKKNNLLRIDGEGVLIARGSSYNHDWHFRLAFPKDITGSGELKLYDPDDTGKGKMMESHKVAIKDNVLDITPFQSTVDIFRDPDKGAFANTLWDSTKVQGRKFSFSIDVKETKLKKKDLKNIKRDPYLYVIDTGYEIHLPEYQSVMGDDSLNVSQGNTQFVDDQGYPFAMIFPESWDFPNEYVDMGTVYPKFVNYIASGNKKSKNWYKKKREGGVTNFNKNKWMW